MKRKIYWLLAAALGIPLVAIVLFVTGPSEPKYRGIALRRWLDATVVTEKIVTREEWHLALETAGEPETIPWLMRLVQSRDSLLDRQHLQLCRKYAWARKWLPKSRLGPFHTARYNGARMLARLAPGTEFEGKALNALISMQPDGTTDFRGQQFHWLSRFTNSPQLVVPVLLTGITNVPTFDASVAGLQRFGAAAVPSLYHMALPETGFIRPAELALEKVDPDAYRKLRDEKENAMR